MKSAESLKKTWQFKRVYNRGKSKADGFLVVYAFENGSDVNRLGLSVSKKVGGNNVRRNRIKRLIRENYRIFESGLKKGFDFVVVARKPVSQATFHQVENSLMNLFSKLRITGDADCGVSPKE